LPVTAPETGKSVIERRCGGIFELHLYLGLGGLPFVTAATKFGSAGVGGTVARGVEEPAGQRCRVNRRGLAGEDDEDGLSDVLGQGGIFNLSKGRGVDETDVAID
jgi:hypothetical protein